jgi:hypothetical protein
MPAVSKKPGDSFLITGTVKNVGNVSIDLGLKPVLVGPKTYELTTKWYGVIPAGGWAPIYQSDKIPSDAPAGTYRLYMAAIDRSTGTEFQRVDTLWDITVEVAPPAVKKIELSSISVS